VKIHLHRALAALRTALVKNQASRDS
jgi:hypothetical protein